MGKTKKSSKKKVIDNLTTITIKESRRIKLEKLKTKHGLKNSTQVIDLLLKSQK